MVYPMLINTQNNKLEIRYKQQLTINKVNTAKGYVYKEITIPTELIRYYHSITQEEIKTIYYVLCNYNGSIKHFITPLEVTEDTEISSLYPAAEEIITPERIIKLKVGIHGNKTKNPRYFFRLNEKLIAVTEDYILFSINPYLVDPVSKVCGLCRIDNLILL